MTQKATYMADGVLRRLLGFVTVAFAASVAAVATATEVVLEGCDALTFDKSRGATRQVLKGNVRFRHDNVNMFCDSAYFYSGQNSFDAFGHVRVVQDTVTMVADKMFYDGNTRLMRVRQNITLSSGSFVLTSHKVDYYRDKGYAYYDEGAKMSDPQFELTSRVGYYYPRTRQAFFKNNVDVVSADFKIKADSLRYNIGTTDTEILGRSTIYRDQYVIHTTRALINNNEGRVRLFRRSRVESEDGTRVLVADTIYYERKTGVAHVYGNIDAVDTKQKVAARGNVGEMWQHPVNHGYLTGRAYVMEFSQGDTLYMHADTLRMETEANDTKDRRMTGNHNVRFYRRDFQGKGEQMTYYVKDSLMKMTGNPVLWADANQLTGDTVRLYMKNNRPDWMHITGKALIIARDDSINFNQLSGKEMMGYFEKNNLRRVVMKGNAVSVYFPKDRKGDLIGVNYNEGSQMTIYINDKRKLEKIFLEPGTEGTMYPPFKAPQEALFLKGFNWQQDVRPKSPLDILSNN